MNVVMQKKWVHTEMKRLQSVFQTGEQASGGGGNKWGNKCKKQ